MNLISVLPILLIVSVSARADQLCESFDCESATSASSSSGSSTSSSSNGSTSTSNGGGSTSNSAASPASISVNISSVSTPSSAAWQNPVAAQTADDCVTTQSNFAGDPLLGGSTYCSTKSGNSEPTLYNSATNSFASAAAGKDITFGSATASGSTTSASSSK